MSGYAALLNDLCVGLGFCGSGNGGEPSHVDALIPACGQVTADEFVRWVFQAEGMDPDSVEAAKHAISIRTAFVRHMGAEAVDASALT